MNFSRLSLNTIYQKIASAVYLSLLFFALLYIHTSCADVTGVGVQPTRANSSTFTTSWVRDFRLVAKFFGFHLYFF